MKMLGGIEEGVPLTPENTKTAIGVLAGTCHHVVNALQYTMWHYEQDAATRVKEHRRRYDSPHSVWENTGGGRGFTENRTYTHPPWVDTTFTMDDFRNMWSQTSCETPPPKKTHVELYERLGVAPTATANEIRAGYKARVKEVHPDRNDAPDAAEQFGRVQHAYDVLGNVSRKKAYDERGVR